MNLLSYPLHVVIWRLQHFLRRRVKFVQANAIDRYVTLRAEEAFRELLKNRWPTTSYYREYFWSLYRGRGVPSGNPTLTRATYSKLTVYGQAIGITLESRCLDILDRIYGLTHDVSLLSSSMEAVLDTGSSLSYRDQVLSFLLPLFLPPTSLSKSPHIHALARLLVTFNMPSLVVQLLTKDRLLAYQFASDLVEGGARDFFQGVKAEWQGGEYCSLHSGHELSRSSLGQCGLNNDA